MPGKAQLKKAAKQRSIRNFLSPMKPDGHSTGRRVESPCLNNRNTNTDDHNLTFQFRYQKDTVAVACDTSNTLLEALDTNIIFKKIKKKNLQKEIVLQRSRGEIPRAAVKMDFPCCLIDKDEIIDVTFIKREGGVFTQQKPICCLSALKSENLVTFYIKTKPKGKVKQLMRNKELWKNDIDFVCVYALKHDTLLTALKCDGRFNNIIFTQKQCVLSEFGSETIHEMSHPVRHLDRKHFLVTISDNNQSDSQTNIPSDADVKENVDPHQPLNIGQEKGQENSTDLSANWPKIIPESKDVLKTLRDENKHLLEKLRQQKNFKGKFQIKKFFRAEYDRTIQSFSEVKKVKKLMRLSDSVCQIRMEGSARGTAFLLFNRFILTNAHVIGEFDPFTRKLQKNFTAVFGFEDLEQKETKRVAIREHAAAYFHGKDEQSRHLDFALLELDDVDEAIDFPELLSYVSDGPPPNKAQICIVGHPGDGVKRIDPCFVIGRENRQEAAQNHVSENVNFYHVITQQSLAEKWEMHKNQITYDSCFFHGSSGSPVFDEDCRLIGVHTGGYVYRAEGGKTRSIMEYAYSIQPILENIIKQAKNNKRADIIELLSNLNSFSLNLSMEANDVEMEEP